MKRSRIAQMAVAGLAVAAALTMNPATAAISKDGNVPTFSQFESSTYREDTKQYVVNGDETVAGKQQLRDFYDEMVHTDDEATPTDGLIINRTFSGDDKWSATQARNLTYCVSTRFGTSYTTVKNAMAQGAALWESASSGVNFVYVSSADSSCTTSNNAVVFSVEPTTTNQYIARAFFPSSSDSQRNILVNASSLVSSGTWEPSDILAHELGHTLGFRHEHTRPEAGTCFEDNNWRPLTPYDSVSIMHYPQCNGGSSDLEFSSNDGVGVRAVYGS